MVEIQTALEPLRDGWNELATRSRNVFATWEWVSTWWKHFGESRPLLVVASRSHDGRLRAVLPLHLATRFPLRILRFVGYGPADQLGPVCAPCDRPQAARALEQALARAPWHWDVLLAEHLSAEEGWAARLGGRLVAQTPSPVIPLEGGWGDFLARLRPNARAQIRRKERKLEREYGLRYRLADDPERLQADLDVLFSLHEARWPQGSSFAAARAFHTDFATRAFQRGWLRLWFLEVRGRPRAAWLGFRFGGVESYYQAGRDPAWNPFSVGSVLLAHSIREAIRDGVCEYRMGRGDEPFKYRIALDTRLETIGLARGAAGKIALATTPLLKIWRPRRLDAWYHAYRPRSVDPETERLHGGAG